MKRMNFPKRKEQRRRNYLDSFANVPLDQIKPTNLEAIEKTKLKLPNKGSAT